MHSALDAAVRCLAHHCAAVGTGTQQDELRRAAPQDRDERRTQLFGVPEVAERADGDDGR